MGGADSARDVHLFPRHVLPESFASCEQAFISGQPGHVRHPGIEINRTHRVSHRFLLLSDRQMRLIVGITLFLFMSLFHPVRLLQIEIIGSGSPLVHKKAAQLQVFFLPGLLIQAHQRHFRDLMAGIALLLSFFRSEAGKNVICIPLGGLQKLILSRGLIIGHGPFRQVTEAVQLMIVLQIGKDFVLITDNIIGIQIAVFQLGRTDDVDGPVGSCLQLRVRMLGQGIAHRLDPFGKVAVLKQAAVKPLLQMVHVLRKRLKFQRPFHRPVGFPFLSSFRIDSPRHLKIAHGKAGVRVRNPVIQRFPLIGNDLLSHQLHLIFPELVRHLHLSQGKRTAVFLLIHLTLPFRCRRQHFNHGLLPPQAVSAVPSFIAILSGTLPRFHCHFGKQHV